MGIRKFRRDLVSWYVTHVMIPGIVKYNHPGFVVTELNTSYGRTYQRDTIFSENQLSNFESEVVKTMGEQGKKLLYEMGVNFGFSYAHFYNAPQISKVLKSQFEDFIPFFSDFIGATWGRNSKCVFDMKMKTLELEIEDYAVCRKNGLGYMLTSGCIGGGWRYMVEDDSAEGVQLSCSGRSSRFCKVICAPAEILKKRKIKFLKSVVTEKFSYSEEYLIMNKIRDTTFSSVSMRDLISSGIFKFKKSQILFHNERYFPMGIEFFYILEKYALKYKKIGDILFRTSFDQGFEMAKKEIDNEFSSFIPDFLSALGLGDVKIDKNKKISVICNMFPWLDYWKDIKYIFLRGLLSGLLSGFLGKKIMLTKSKAYLLGGLLTVEVSE